MLRVACLAAVLGLLAIGAKSQPSQEQLPQSAQQQINPEQRGTEQSPFIIKIAPQEALDKSKPALPDQTEGKEMTWSGMFREWGLSEKIAAIASVVAFLQLVALLAIVLAISRKSKRELRAYVSMETGVARVVNDPNGEPVLEGYVKLKNFGKTPAFEYRSYVMIKVLNVNAPPFEETSVASGRGLLGPGAETEQQVYWRISEGDLAAIRAGTKRIFLWGEAYYVDAFGKNRHFKFYNVNAAEELAGLGWPLLAADKSAEAN